MLTAVVIFYSGGKFKFQSNHVFYFDIIHGTGMEEEQSPPVPSEFSSTRLARVTSAFLDPHKNWYVLTKELCGGTRPVDFLKNGVFKIFPDEVKVIASRELEPANLSRWNRQPRNLCVASSFGLCAGLLRQREIPADGLISSPSFQSVARIINSITLDLEPLTPPSKVDSGGKMVYLDQLESNIQIESLKAEMDALQAEIRNLQSQVQEKTLGDSISLSISSPESTKSFCSSLTCSGRSSPTSPSTSSSSIEEIKSSPLGSTTKKRQIAKQCSQVMASLNDVSEKYRESVSSVLGNAFIFGNENEKEQVRDTISEVVDMVLDAKGPKKGLSDLLSSSTYGRIMKSMRVPDWALLFFKLQSRLPDSAWQTLLNLTQLGKSEVSIHSYLILFLFLIKSINLR